MNALKSGAIPEPFQISGGAQDRRFESRCSRNESVPTFILRLQNRHRFADASDRGWTDRKSRARKR
jgi:hypothetical protein